ncbi:MAG: hypothetical protein D3916_14980 [Candidatus Electrothrix sp. MAN1_4]|nr:hypothetical protein [Candidatus Electrothrix sp. MAN1_4]
MDAAILAILQKNTFAFVIALFFILLSFLVKTTRSFLVFHEEIFVKRYINRLSSLTKEVETGSTTYNYLKTLKEDEVFLVASGIKTYPQKTKILMEIYQLGVVSKGELKRLPQYIKPDNNKIFIEVNWFDKFSFFYSFISMLTFFSFGFYIVLSSCISGEFVKMIAGIVIFFIFILLGLILGRDYITSRILSRVKEQLVKHNMVTNPDKKIDWNINLWPRPAKANKESNETE